MANTSALVALPSLSTFKTFFDEYDYDDSGTSK